MMDYLARYFGRELNARLVLDNGLAETGPLVYCESYYHCHQTPCPHAATNFQKSHDFGSQVEYRPDRFYLVQTRQPLPAIISNYKLVVKLKHRQESFFRWRRFFRKSLNEWVRFQRKWVCPDHSNVFVLRYEELTAHPQQLIRDVLAFLNPRHRIDESWYHEVVNSIGVFSKDTVSPFKYYSDDLQKEVDCAIAQHMIQRAA
jgi:hypothetical protein